MVPCQILVRASSLHWQPFLFSAIKNPFKYHFLLVAFPGPSPRLLLLPTSLLPLVPLLQEAWPCMGIFCSQADSSRTVKSEGRAPVWPLKFSPSTAPGTQLVLSKYQRTALFIDSRGSWDHSWQGQFGAGPANLEMKDHRGWKVKGGVAVRKSHQPLLQLLSWSRLLGTLGPWIVKGQVYRSIPAFWEPGFGQESRTVQSTLIINTDPWL